MPRVPGGADPQAAIRAGQVIGEALEFLEQFRDAGQIDEVYPDLQPLVIPFGQSGYIALYQYEPVSDQVFILAFQHQREVGF